MEANRFTFAAKLTPVKGRVVCESCPARIKAEGQGI